MSFNRQHRFVSHAVNSEMLCRSPIAEVSSYIREDAIPVKINVKDFRVHRKIAMHSRRAAIPTELVFEEVNWERYGKREHRKNNGPCEAAAAASSATFETCLAVLPFAQTGAFTGWSLPLDNQTIILVLNGDVPAKLEADFVRVGVVRTWRFLTWSPGITTQLALILNRVPTILRINVRGGGGGGHRES
mmetsp:Transcript_34621/g.67369  ORF Transcript_34621/g.67369 Transcript_34621/m.67369 type:complete len:189 (+) Transcript_34621:484-1050(+)